MKSFYLSLFLCSYSFKIIQNRLREFCGLKYGYNVLSDITNEPNSSIHSNNYLHPPNSQTTYQSHPPPYQPYFYPYYFQREQLYYNLQH